MNARLDRLTEEYNSLTVEACETALRTILASVSHDWRHRIVLIGGMVPPYLYEEVAEGVDPHIGTNDIDIGIGILVDDGDEEVYATLEEKVRECGFQPTDRRWRYRRVVNGVTVLLEFLCPADEAELSGRTSVRPVGGEGGLHALAVRGVQLVPLDTVKVELEGETLDRGGRVSVDMNVANILPFVMLKAYAHHGRNKEKDAYDLVWVLVAHPEGPAGAAIAAVESPIRDEPEVEEAFEILSQFYQEPDRAGPARFAEFELARLGREPTDDLRTGLRRYAHGALQEFLAAWVRARD